MLKKGISLLLAFIMIAGIFAGCAEKEEQLPPEASSLETVKTIALEIGEAVMRYDLQTLRTYSVLPLDAADRILNKTVPRDENGNVQWEGQVYDGLESFLSAFDTKLDVEYENLALEVTNADILELVDADSAFDRAHARERKYRRDYEFEMFLEENSKLVFVRAAVVTLQIRYQEKEEDGTPGQRKQAQMEVVLVWEGDSWKAFSPNLTGMFRPGIVLNRYLINE